MVKRIFSFLLCFLLALSFLIIFPLPINAYTTGMSASLVIGQADFTSNSQNQGGSVSAQGLDQPYGITIVGNKLIVADADNNRVLIYNSIPTSNNVSADVVVGQANFISNSDNQGGSLAANTLSFPYDVASDGTKLFVADWGNDRVLVYNAIPTSNDASADVVIGQVNMTTDVADTTDSSLIGPGGVHYNSSSGKLIITDWGNNRVMIYNTPPTSNGAAANVVVGQSDFVSSSSGTSATELSFPVFSKVFNNKLFITDEFNGRVLIFNSIPTTNGASADVVIGKTTMTAETWEESGPTATILDDTSGVYSDGTRLFIGDGTSARLLIYDSVPTSNGAAANIVLGQTSFTSDTTNAGGLSASSLAPIMGGIAHNDVNLFVSDTSNHRILRYTNESPTPTPTPTSAPSDTISSQASIYNPEWPSDLKYCSHSGPATIQSIHIVSGSSVLGNAMTMVSSDASVHDVHIKIDQQSTQSLENENISLPEQQFQRVGEIFNYKSLSAFNGYPIEKFDKPVTIILPYDPFKFLDKDPERLRIAFYDDDRNRWTIMTRNTVLHTFNHTIANTTKAFSYFTVVYY